MSEEMTREDAIKILKRELGVPIDIKVFPEVSIALNMAIEALENKKSGYWKNVGNNPNYSPFDGSSPYIYKCSCCGSGSGDYLTKYCYECGAKMEDIEDDNR